MGESKVVKEIDGLEYSVTKGSVGICLKYKYDVEHKIIFNGQVYCYQLLYVNQGALKVKEYSIEGLESLLTPYFVGEDIKQILLRMQDLWFKRNMIANFEGEAAWIV